MDGPEPLIVKYTLSNNEQSIVENFKSVATRLNTTRNAPIPALSHLKRNDIAAIATGSQHFAILLKNGVVARLGFHKKTVVPVSPNTVQRGSASTNQSQQPAFKTNAPKYRRVMLSGPRRDRGVIVDRTRPLLPATEVPEDLIVQAQVVLQGKSREVIIRELQRTNLNVNEAVNNLLSKDDDEDDADEGASEVCLPEELLSLLDASQVRIRHGATGILEDGYAGEFDYLVQRGGFERRRQAEKKDKKNADAQADTQEYSFDDKLVYWTKGQGCDPDKGPLFQKITACASELYGLHVNGKVYGWKWSMEEGDLMTHEMAHSIIGSASIIDIASSYLRVCVCTDKYTFGTWLDPEIVKGRLGKPFELPCVKIEHKTMPTVDTYLGMFCTNINCGFVLSDGTVYWSGLYPFAERKELFEKNRDRLKKSTRTDVELKLGMQVRNKASPVYSAGSVAVWLKDGIPKVGLLMEHAWTLSDMCRFKVMDPETYDQDKPSTRSTNYEHVEATFSSSGSRKRKANSELTFDIKVPREEAWWINEVVFIHEEHVKDVGIVDTIDGDMAMVVYSDAVSRDYTTDFATSSSAAIAKEKEINGAKCILSKDKFVPVSNRTPRAPLAICRSHTGFRLPIQFQKICSFLADDHGLRLLVFDVNRYSLVRVSMHGNILSKHTLPLALNLPENCPFGYPKLLNFGEEHLLLLQATPTSCAIPLFRDSDKGFRSLSSLHLPSVSQLSAFVYPFKESNKTDAKKVAVIMSLVCNSDEAIAAEMPQLFKAVLACDVDVVRSILEKVAGMKGEEQAKLLTKIYGDYTELGGSVLHAAVMLATSATNRDQADIHELGKNLPKWSGRMLRSAAKTNETAAAVTATVEPKPPKFDITPVVEAKQRQANAIEMVKLFSGMMGDELFRKALMHKDVNGYTPLTSAIEHRAYSAATTLWRAIKDRKMNVKDFLLPPPSFSGKMENNLGWALFVICYNDTCSFTWTGEEHINQDIFECRTCGLTGSLCCCTECAFTCHRGHDCQLKRTSPTAYCDCWEKCACKALVAGNRHERNKLLELLLADTDAYKFSNPTGQHILFFLAKTLARQTAEQSTWKKRRTVADAGPSDSTPEHNLNPPNFISMALTACLDKLDIVEHFFMAQVNARPDDGLVDDIALVAMGQSMLSEQTDMFVYLLLVKCPILAVNNIVKMLKAQAELNAGRVNKIISRMLRAVLRIYNLLVAISPAAAMIAANGVWSKKKFNVPIENKRQQQAEQVISGFLGIVRKHLVNKESKKEAVCEAVTRCHNIFQEFPVLTITETSRMAMSIFTPVMIGRVKATTAFAANHSKDWDALDIIENSLMPKPAAKEAKPQKEPVVEDDDGSELGSEEGEGDRNERPFSHRLLSLSSNTGLEEAEANRAVRRRARVPGDNAVAGAVAAVDDSSDSYSSMDEEESEGEENEEMEEDNGEHEEENEDEEALEMEEEPLFRELAEAEEAEEYMDDIQLMEEGEHEEDGEHPDDRDQPASPAHSPPPALAEPPAGGEPIEEEDTRQAGEEGNNTEDGNRANVADGGEVLQTDRDRRRTLARRTQNIVNATVGIVEDLRRRAGENAFQPPVERRETEAVREAVVAAEEGQSGSNTESTNQLCSIFYVQVRLVYEMILDFYKKETGQGYDERRGAPVSKRLLELVEEQFSQAWSWLKLVADVNESQIKLAVSRRSEKGNKFNPDTFMKETESSPSMTDYVIELMRTNGGEQGDRVPIVDTEQMKLLTLPIDAFLYRCRVMDTLEVLRRIDVEQEPPINPYTRDSFKAALFFSRSLDFAYPGMRLKSNVDILSDKLPYARDPHMLKTDFEKRSLFDEHSDLRQDADGWNETFNTQLDMKVRPGSSYSHNPLSVNFVDQKECDEDFSALPSVRGMKMFSGKTEVQGLYSLAEKDPVVNSLEQQCGSRWRHLLPILARSFHNDILFALGSEMCNSVLLEEHSSYKVRADFFRTKVFEFVSQCTNKDVVLDKLKRDHRELIQETVFQLNTQYMKRTKNPPPHPPLFSQKLKISFDDEPGEGSGVARSFYTEFANALMSQKELPFIEYGYGKAIEDYMYGGGAATPGNIRAQYRRQVFTAEKKSSLRREELSLSSEEYQPRDTSAAEVLAKNIFKESDHRAYMFEATLIRRHSSIADRIYAQVCDRNPLAAPRITGMLAELSVNVGVSMLSNAEELKGYIQDAVQLLANSTNPDDKALVANEPGVVAQPPDTAPLFYQPTPELPFFAPCPGHLSPMRMSAFRNIGRIIGMCLAQQQVFPFRLPRHVWKALLEIPLNFHDLAFLDYPLYESLRGLLRDIRNNDPNLGEKLAAMALSHTTVIPAQEHDGKEPLEMDLSQKVLTNGSDTVNEYSLFDYVQVVTRTRLERSALEQVYTSMRTGIYDVLPDGYLKHFNVEDMQLMVSGVLEVSLERMKDLTNFLEECKASPEDVARLRKWFWEVVATFTPSEKQDLVFFWTGSSTLPALDESFVPCPTVVLRNLGDAYLPTANTCISRLYIPVYSSKRVLLAKLKEAIQIKTFGFV